MKLFKDKVAYKLIAFKSYMCVCVCVRQDFILNNLQGLIFLKPNDQSMQCIDVQNVHQEVQFASSCSKTKIVWTENLDNQFQWHKRRIKVWMP